MTDKVLRALGLTEEEYISRNAANDTSGEKIDQDDELVDEIMTKLS